MKKQATITNHEYDANMNVCSRYPLFPCVAPNKNAALSMIEIIRP
jgi:hypothetical protein